MTLKFIPVPFSVIAVHNALSFTFEAMQQGVISYKKSKISFLSMGKGSRVVICFPGYGEDSAVCSFLGKYASEEFTFIAVDLPYHGKTEWNEGLNFCWHDLENIISAILSYQIPSYKPSDRIILLGFSLGGRVALSLFQAIPNQIEKVVLLAPDGLKVNFWYWLSTQTWFGNRLFLFTMKHPSWFFSFLKLMNGLGLVNASIFKFVKFYIGDKNIRELLYKRWTALRKLKPDRVKIKKLIRQNKIFFHLFYGKHDRIILPVRGRKFRKGVEEYCTLSIIESGHQVLHDKHAEDILPALRSNSH